MSREICIYQHFLTPPLREKIERTARETGFLPHFFTLEEQAEAEKCLARCEILYAASLELLKAAPPTLRWYCCSNAGVEIYCGAEDPFPNPECLFTNSNVYGLTIAEHIVMVSLLLLRRMPEYDALMDQRIWSNPHFRIRSVQGTSFTLLGTGDIGTHTARLLRALGAGEILGVNRSGKAPSADFDEIHTLDDLDDLLRRTTVLVMALPQTPQTVRLLSRERISLLPKDALVINVGRGSAVDQQALMEALERGDLSGAALDVMEPEPLPPDHPLWTTKNLILTPHSSGNMSLEHTCDVAVDLFCENLRRYAANRPLLGVVDRKAGY